MGVVRNFWRNAGSSWRPFQETDWWNNYPVVIGSDGGPRRSFDVYVSGQLVATRAKLTDAMAAAELETKRSLVWNRTRLPVAEAPEGTQSHDTWGPTTEFSTPRVVWTAS